MHNIPFFYCWEYKKYKNTITLKDVNGKYGSKDLYLTANRDDMNNLACGTEENLIPVLKDVGVDESILNYDKDYDKAYMDCFCRENVIRYLKNKMSKSEF